MVFRGPTLAQAWQYTSAAPKVKLDLKQSDQRFLDALVAFLHEHGGDPGRVLVTSPDVDALHYLQSRLPGVTLLFSANGPDAVRRLRADTQLQGAIGGVSVFQGLVDANLVQWAHARHLLVLAWTVDDAARLDQLVRLGVDGVTTANLAVLRALS
jgi:glycerophosphoryl diester phosphodiesterase